MSTNINSQISATVLCCYKNHTNRVQIGQIASIRGENIEKVILPGERFLFEARANMKLAIYVELAGTTTLLDSIPCSKLQVET